MIMGLLIDNYFDYYSQRCLPPTCLYSWHLDAIIGPLFRLLNFLACASRTNREVIDVVILHSLTWFCFHSCACCFFDLHSFRSPFFHFQDSPLRCSLHPLFQSHLSWARSFSLRSLGLGLVDVYSEELVLVLAFLSKQYASCRLETISADVFVELN